MKKYKSLLCSIVIFILCCAISIYLIQYKIISADHYNSIIIPMLVIFTISISFFEYNSHKDANKNIIFNKLNDIYTTNKDIRYVTQYLTNDFLTQKDDARRKGKPTQYQIEMFLRFFEEVELFIRNQQVNATTIKTMFSYYLMDIMDKDGAHHDLLRYINFKETEWPLLVSFYNRMKGTEDL